jgi:ribosome-associated protein
METLPLVDLIVKTLEDNKAEDITSLDVHELTTVTSWMVICTANSKRQARALGDYVVTKVKETGVKPLGMEGATDSDWLLVDLGEIVVHIMLPDARAFYSLETLKARDGD